MSGDLDDLYRATILDHYQTPRNHGRLAAANLCRRGSNPLCGDEIELWLAIAVDRIVDVAFEGRGCSISQASASLMTVTIKGRSLQQATAVARAFGAMLAGSTDGPSPDAWLSDLEVLQAVRRYPVRVKCALLPWTVLREGLEAYEAGPGVDVESR